MKMPGKGLVQKAQSTAQTAESEVNEVRVPLTNRLGLAELAKQLFKDIGDNHIGAFAGALTYSALFALFPFAVFLLSLLGIFHMTQLVSDLTTRLSATMPRSAVNLIDKQILGSVARSRATGTFTVGAIISLLAALWGISGGFRAVMEAMNVVYGVKDSRPFWKKYLISIGLALTTAVLVITALVLVVFGPAIGGAVANLLGLGAAFQWAWNILQWPVLLAFVLAAFGIIYYFAPDVKQELKFVSPGSLVALGLWIVFSLLFSLYVNSFSTYNKSYGAMAGIAILLLYMYYSAFILLVGGDIDHIIERNAPDGKDEGERTPPGESSRREGEDPSTLRILKENRPATVDATDRR